MLCTVTDPIQNVTPISLNQWYWLPTALLATVVVILVITLCTQRVSVFLVVVVLTIYVVVMCIREVVAEFVDPCTMPETYPDRNADRYIITGHLLTCGLIAYVVAKSTAPMGAKIWTVGVAIMIGLVSVVTREHYTDDVLVTIAILFAIMAVTWRL